MHLRRILPTLLPAAALFLALAAPAQQPGNSAPQAAPALPPAPSATELHATYAAQPIPDGKPHTFAVSDGQFTLDGKPFRLISGEMHYPRIPREYWRARLRMAKAMGLNAITTYVFWNVHEPTPGHYDFSGQNDVAEFIREAQQEGLWVILRPGPYVCAEWEFGGYPAWLLKDPDIQVRTSDPKFMQPATRWLHRLGQELAPLQTGNGGPILLVQVENEYGSWGSDHAYMEQIKQAIVDSGFTKAQLYTADGPGVIANGSLPELPVGINFDGNRADEAAKSFAKLMTIRPDGPFFNSEFWAGWFDHWGGQHAHTNAQTQADNLAWELAHGFSVSIYMFCGGTDFGWMNGANSDDIRKKYEPDVTSYDYDAALDESGRPTPKYFAFRDVIAKATGLTPPPVPAVAAPIAVPPIRFTEFASLWDNLPTPIESDHPLTMEEIGQNYGWILYRTTLSQTSQPGRVTVHDFAQTYLDEQPGTGIASDRRVVTMQLGVQVAPDSPPQRWDILAENSGRINYSHQLASDRKGVVKYTGNGGSAPAKWLMYPLPMQDLSTVRFTSQPCSGPCFYRATFDVAQPGDTFLDTSQLVKGAAWINGHALGRFWKIGPQKTLYVPGPWLKPGLNQLLIFDLNANPAATVQGLTKPMLGD